MFLLSQKDTAKSANCSKSAAGTKLWRRKSELGTNTHDKFVLLLALLNEVLTTSYPCSSSAHPK